MKAPDRLKSPDWTFQGPLFDAQTARAYVRCSTMNAWYQWRKRHHILVLQRGLIPKADLDRALRAKRTPPGPKPGPQQHPKSLANLLRSSKRRHPKGPSHASHV